MTLNQTIAKVSAEIDALLQEQLDAMALEMIGDGADPMKPPPPEDVDGDWHRVTFDEILEEQRARDAQWKVEALAQIRKWLEAELLSMRASPNVKPDRGGRPTPVFGARQARR